MQINLFSELKISSKSSRRFTYYMGRPISLKPNVLDVIDNDRLPSEDLKMYLFDVKDKEQVINDILGLPYNSHFPLEVMNLSTSSKGYMYVFDFKNVYYYAIASVIGSTPSEVRGIPKIDEFIQIISTLQFDDFSLSSIIGHCDLLDLYFDKHVAGINNLQDAITAIVSSFNASALGVIKYVSSYLETYSDVNVITFHKRFLVCTGNSDNLIGDLNLVTPDGHDMTVSVTSYNDNYSYYEKGGLVNGL